MPMRDHARQILVADIRATVQALAGTVGRAHPVTGALVTKPRLAWVMADLDDWATLGWPTGGSDAPVAGGDADPLPERVGIALADGDLSDTCAADLLELETGLRLVHDELNRMRAIVARHTPLDVEQRRRILDDRPTATCGVESPDPLLKGCGATISRVGDDRPRRGLCPACYKAWLRVPRPEPVPTDDVAGDPACPQPACYGVANLDSLRPDGR